MLHDRLCCFISVAFIVLMFGSSYVQSLSQITNVFVGKLWVIANPPLPPPPPSLTILLKD